MNLTSTGVNYLRRSEERETKIGWIETIYIHKNIKNSRFTMRIVCDNNIIINATQIPIIVEIRRQGINDKINRSLLFRRAFDSWNTGLMRVARCTFLCLKSALKTLTGSCTKASRSLDHLKVFAPCPVQVINSS